MNSSIAFVYIAGPFSPTAVQNARIASGQSPADEPLRSLRDAVEENIRRAVALGVKVSRLGAFPVVPHAMTAASEFEETQPYEFWIKATRELLTRCDAVVFLDDWQDSPGARGENELAIDVGIPRFFSLSDLAEWLLPEVARLNVLQPRPVLEPGTVLETEESPAPTLPPDAEHLPKLASLPADWLAQAELTIAGYPIDITSEDVEFDSNPFVLASEQPTAIE